MVPGIYRRRLASEDSARHLYRDSGAGHSLHTRLFSKCHAPPLSKMLTNTRPKSLRYTAKSGTSSAVRGLLSSSRDQRKLRNAGFNYSENEERQTVIQTGDSGQCLKLSLILRIKKKSEIYFTHF